MNLTENAKKITDNCRFCWMCRHVCPIGNATGHERNTARARAFAVSMVERGATELSEVVDNIYECSLCGACTNNCVTGFDPKVFIQETKTEIVLSGLTPDYILALVEKCLEYGNVWGADMPDMLKNLCSEEGDVLFLAGTNAEVKAPECICDALGLIRGAGIKAAFTSNQNTGSALWFLTGKTGETQQAAKEFAKHADKYKTVVVYDPDDMAFISHQYKEWGIEMGAKLISFNAFLLSLIKDGKIKVTKSECEYTLQDNASYARELDDTESGRALIGAVGKSKDMLLCGKEANLAGQLIMAEYMPEAMAKVARDRWTNAVNMECRTVVTESPAEYVALKATLPDGYRVITVEQMIKENM
ncbi:MAG: (Fe-S)-binding protein [Ruminococcaceae bacterium]|nr:(Fe-S)-binding protein [Oscillospiraceae bacterium]